MQKLVYCLLLLTIFLPLQAQRFEKREKTERVFGITDPKITLKSQGTEILYHFQLTDIEGNPQTLAPYKNKVLLIVNTASKCGYTPQYKELEALYKLYKDKGLMVIAFPSAQFANQEFDTNEQTADFCSKNFNITFPLMSKTDVKGHTAHPLFTWLIQKAKQSQGNPIRWNFTKFLVSPQGDYVLRYEPGVSPLALSKTIEHLLNKN